MSVQRSELLLGRDDDDDDSGGKAGGGSGIEWGYTSPAYACVNRPQSSQIVLNGIYQGRDIRLGGGEGEGTGLRSSSTTTTKTTVPFISTENSEVFCHTFCDFRPNFKVANEDGEVPRETPLDGVEAETTGEDGDGEREGAATILVLSCLEGERHEVSKGGIIEFQWTRGGSGGMGGRREEEEYRVWCEVLRVQSPTFLKIGLCTTNARHGGGGDKLAMTHQHQSVHNKRLHQMIK